MLEQQGVMLVPAYSQAARTVTAHPPRGRIRFWDFTTLVAPALRALDWERLGLVVNLDTTI